MNIDQSPSVGKFNTRVQLLPEAKADLMLWSELSPQSNRDPMIPAPASLVIESDASNMGWGATDGHSQTGGLWSVEEAAHHINFLELLAVFLALKTFAKEHSQCSILCKSNYISAMTYLNQKGGMHSSLLCSLALEIWDWCLARGITLTAETPPGVGQSNSRPRVQNMSRLE